MLKIDPHSNSLLPLGRRTLEPAPLFERLPVIELVANSADIFFADLGRALFLIGHDVLISRTTGRRADLLLLDPDGRLIVGRLQRGADQIDLVEALEDAGFVTSWSPERVLALLDDERRELLQKAFLKAPVESINSEQGLLLLAERYDVDTLAAAGWLRTRYGVRIECYQLRLATDSLTGIDYLNCQDLNERVQRVYQERKSSEADGAPWPAAAVPDISDQPLQQTPKPASAPGAEAPQAEAEAPEAPEPEPRRGPTPATRLESQTEPAAPQPAPADAAPLEAEVAAALDDEGQESIDETAEIEAMVIPEDLAPEDDPLADVIAGLEAADEPPMQGPPPSDRRVAGRSRDYQARRLRLDYFGRLLGARLVDFSSTGLGVEALSPLPVGAEIGISGELSSEKGTLGIEGRAKVEHCRSTEDGVCRIGFSLEKAKISELDDPETFDRR